MLKLYNYFRSSASFRVRIALNLKNLEYEEIPIHLVNNGGEQYSKSYHEINPQNMVPALEHNEKTITQSLAIIEYLDDLHPNPALLPKEIYLKAFTKSLALLVCADIHPLNNLRVLKYLTAELGLSEEKKNTWYQHWIKTGLTALENKINNSGLSGTFCIGDSPTLADICLVPQMYNARRFDCDVSAYPTLVKIDAHCKKLAAFIKAWPEAEVVS